MNSKYLLICLLVTIALHLVLGKALVEDCAWLTGRLCTWLHKKRSPGLHAVINVSVSKSCELVYHFSIIRNQWCIFVPVSSIFVDFLKRHWLKELLLSMATGSLSCLTPECCRADLFRHSSRIRKDACTVKNTCAFKVASFS